MKPPPGAIRGLDGSGNAATDRIQQGPRVDRAERSAGSHRILYFQGGPPKRGSEEDVHRLLGTRHRIIGEDLAAGHALRLYAFGCRAAGVGDEDDVGDAAAPREHDAAFDIDRRRRIGRRIREEPVLPIADIHAMPGEVDDQLLDRAAHDQRTDRPLEGGDLDRSVFVGEYKDAPASDALRKRPALHGTGAVDGVFEHGQTTGPIHPDQDGCSRHHLPGCEKLARCYARIAGVSIAVQRRARSSM